MSEGYWECPRCGKIIKTPTKKGMFFGRASHRRMHVRQDAKLRQPTGESAP